MDKKLKSKWVKALRSGAFEQTTNGVLLSFGYQNKPEYCCLGVLRHLINPKSRAEHPDMHYLCPTHERRAGLTYEVQEKLATMNDEGKSFAQIAAYIGKHL